MTQQLTAVEFSDADIGRAAEAVRRFLSGRLRDRAQVEDLTQEAVTRLMEARERLDGAAAVPYAMAVARNLLVAGARRADMGRRHAHRVVDRASPPSPEDIALLGEEVNAVATALRALPEKDRYTLVAHVVDERSTAALAAESGGTAGGVAARLSRTRARMRVDYLLAARNVTLPSERCRPVLLALSAGDQRRQRSLSTAHHISDCGTCTDLAPPLLERRRRLLGLIPIPALAPLLGRLRRLARPRHLVQVAAAGVIAAVAVAALAGRADSPTDHQARAQASATPGEGNTGRPRSATPRRRDAPPATDAARPRTAPSQPLPSSLGPGSSRTEVNGATLLTFVGAGTLRSAVGARVAARDLRVESVPADEGFWVGDGPGRRVWVQLIGLGESAAHVTAGAEVTFSGVVASNAGEQLPGRWPDAEDGLAELRQAGAHVEVPVDQLRVASG